MNFLIWLIVIGMLVSSCLGVTDTRAVLASDVESGKLVATDKAKKMISEGDRFLDAAGLKRSNRHDRSLAWENDLYAAFIAKVWYERARLEMELEQ